VITILRQKTPSTPSIARADSHPLANLQKRVRTPRRGLGQNLLDAFDLVVRDGQTRSRVPTKHARSRSGRPASDPAQSSAADKHIATEKGSSTFFLRSLQRCTSIVVGTKSIHSRASALNRLFVASSRVQRVPAQALAWQADWVAHAIRWAIYFASSFRESVRRYSRFASESHSSGPPDTHGYTSTRQLGRNVWKNLGGSSIWLKVIAHCNDVQVAGVLRQD